MTGGGNSGNDFSTDAPGGMSFFNRGQSASSGDRFQNGSTVNGIKRAEIYNLRLYAFSCKHFSCIHGNTNPEEVADDGNIVSGSDDSGFSQRQQVFGVRNTPPIGIKQFMFEENYRIFGADSGFQ